MNHDRYLLWNKTMADQFQHEGYVRCQRCRTLERIQDEFT